jgi:hypothetical protein
MGGIGMRELGYVAVALVAAVSSPAAAESPRELLVSAAFSARDKPTALARIDAALKGADAELARNAKNREAQLQRAVAIGYRGKLKRSRADVLAARRAFEALVAANPRDAEAQMALAGWHLGAVIELGPLVARTALGARKSHGLQALDRAVALGGGRAFFPGYASLNRILLDPSDIGRARALAEAAVKGRATASIDRVMQRQAGALLQALRGGNGKSAARAAKGLLPFGRLPD